MAMSAAEVGTGTHTKVFAVTATADADTGALNIPHGFASTPVLVGQVALLDAARLSQWSFSVGATNIVATKNATTASSGNASAQIQICAMLPHSIIR